MSLNQSWGPASGHWKEPTGTRILNNSGVFKKHLLFEDDRGDCHLAPGHCIKELESRNPACIVPYPTDLFELDKRQIIPSGRKPLRYIL